MRRSDRARCHQAIPARKLAHIEYLRRDGPSSERGAPPRPVHSAPPGGGSGQQGLGSGQLCRMTVPGLLSRMMLFVLPLALPWAGTAAAKDPR
ncbi:hypothetical protein GCM10012285_65090 [Streptomyces kronopolitis]|uniref:Uncharacterized protein n=1 Tax=Streptomyces kronopolitis TaxID=1612435 RepID=A0ABQ2K5C5_9ACTN|nr:hypothetical protein GCM10012285_65090 [Streptomyces kronopolitis]